MGNGTSDRAGASAQEKEAMNELFRILYVDDYPLDRRLVRDALENEDGGFEITEAASREQFEEQLAEKGYDLVLSDFNILGFDGLEVIDSVRAHDPDIPVVIITGTGSEEVAVEAMRRGAADYVIKTPECIRHLPHTIRAAVHERRLVDQKRRAEAEIRRLNAALEQRVVERTGQLQAANEQLQAFAYSVSHDLRAPLRAIRGFGEIIARRHRQDLNQEAREYIDNIVEAGRQMDHLINDLLAYSRLGHRAVAHHPVRLGSLLAQVNTNLAGRIADTGARVTIPDDLPEIMGDRTLLNGVFANLLDNALTYHRSGVPLRVEVTCQTEAEEVILRVTDNGIGIPPESQEKIFDLFQRLHDEDEFPGTGIGLAVVKKSVELLGGRVWVESKVGSGSTFAVHLPRT